jgi:hypothetical protein
VGISQVYDNYIPCITCHLPCIILYMSGCLQKKCKSTELNMHIYTIQYEKLQSGICMTYTTIGMSYVIHIPSCRYKYVIDICPYVSEEMDLAHICKSTDLNMQIYRMEYANLQD